MNNLQVMNKSGGGAAVDLMMKTFTAPKKGSSGGMDFANAFESHVNEVKPYDSFIADNSESFSDQFSFENQNAYEAPRYDEPAPRKEEVVAREDDARPREEENRSVKEEKTEQDVPEEKAKDNADDETVSDKDTESENKADEKSSDEDKSEDTAEENSGDKAGDSEEEKSAADGEKTAQKVDLDDVEFKTEKSDESVEVKEVKVETEVDVELKQTESKTEEDSPIVEKGEVQDIPKEVAKEVVDQGVLAQDQIEDDIDVEEESISTQTTAADQVKTEAIQMKQGQFNDNQNKSGGKKLVQKRDMVDQLEKETGVKIDKMSMEKVKTSPDEVAQKTSKDLLKSLDTNRGRFNLQDAKSARMGGADAKDTVLTDKPELKLNKLDIAKNFIKNNTAQTKAETSAPTNNESSNSFANVAKDQSALNMNRAGKAMQQAQAGNTPNLRNMNNVQEIMNNLKTMLRGSDFQANAKLTLDFQTQALGQMRMGMMHKNGGIEVSIEVGSDSSRQELMKQKDELSEQLRQLGYKNVNVDISYGEHQQQQDAQQQQMSGNEDIRNVKLAGDDAADLSELLSMV